MKITYMKFISINGFVLMKEAEHVASQQRNDMHNQIHNAFLCVCVFISNKLAVTIEPLIKGFSK